MLGHSPVSSAAIGESPEGQVRYRFLLATANSVATVTRSLINKFLTVTSTSTASISKVTAKILSAVSTSTAVISKGVRLIRLAVSTAVSTLLTLFKPFPVLGVRIRILDDPRFIKIKKRRE